MKKLIFLLMSACSSYWGDGELQYQIQNGDRQDIQEAMRYLEGVSGGRVRFVENYKTTTPDIVFVDNPDICNSATARIMIGYHYWNQVEMCPGPWLNKGAIYAHELLHGFGLEHIDDENCIMQPSTKDTMVMCEQEKDLFLKAVGHED